MLARGAKIRGVLQTRGPGRARSGRRAEEDCLDPAHIARDFTENPALREAYDHLKTGLCDPALREVVLKTLRPLVQRPHQP